VQSDIAHASASSHDATLERGQAHHPWDSRRTLAEANDRLVCGSSQGQRIGSRQGLLVVVAGEPWLSSLTRRRDRSDLDHAEAKTGQGLRREQVPVEPRSKNHGAAEREPSNFRSQLRIGPHVAEKVDHPAAPNGRRESNPMLPRARSRASVKGKRNRSGRKMVR
jgi:hypothetical protein